MLFFRKADRKTEKIEKGKEKRGKGNPLWSYFSLFSCIFSLPLIISACGSGGTGPAARSAPIPNAPVGVVATARESNNLISWSVVQGAASYNIYWSVTTGVNKTNGTKIAAASNPYVHLGLTNSAAYYYVVTAVSAGGEGAESAQVAATPVAVVAGIDPLFGDQWHLKNTGQVSGTSGQDVNAESVWTTYKGGGVRIAIVDDGLEIGHEDLAANIASNILSYNYVTGSTDPTEDPSDISEGNGHGTAVAGIVAARDLNNLGGRGAAPRANLVGYNFLQNTTFSNLADAMTRGAPNVYISNNSWGATDGEGTLVPAPAIWRNAINTGLTRGRNGLGTIYTFAAGNGATGGRACRRCVDNANYDGLANYRGVVAVAAVNDRGIKSSYSESGANLWISAPGGEFCNTHTITTTDRTGAINGFNTTTTAGVSDYANANYTRCMNGTSAATPGVAGVIALVLEANPNLGWRDVRLILAETARKNDAADTGWAASVTTPIYNFNHKYGFGVIDAQAAVNRALTWTNVGPEVTFTTPIATPRRAILDNNTTGVASTINVTGSGITSIEFIEITFSAADHIYSGNLEITLTSTTSSNTISRLAEQHFCADDVCIPYNAWVFGSARHLGEAANGTWTLTVRDLDPTRTGTFQSWGLKFYGR